MSGKIQAVRGMNDILPHTIHKWQYLEKHLRAVLSSFGYAEIRFPLVEKTELFKRSIGEVTDIVEKEMYTFEDRNGDSLTLRPEGTAGCVRACIQAGLLYNQVQRLWYMGEMFRYERPQKGRYRQFFQCGVEAFGISSPDIDAELILMNHHIWQRLGLSDHARLQINTLGEPEERVRYREQLVAYLKKHESKLDEDSKRRLSTNPLRVLDSKNEAMQDIISKAPQLIDYLGESSQAHFKQVLAYLDAIGLRYEIKPRLVRGLDYYCHTVYEWVCEGLGAQNAISAGGRYDGLVSQLGGKDTPATGFAIGLDRLLVALESHKHSFTEKVPHVFLMMTESTKQQAFVLSENLRNTLPDLRLVFHCGSGSLKSQFKKADKSGAKIGIVMAEDEAASNSVTIKILREDKPQQKIVINELASWLTALFN